MCIFFKGRYKVKRDGEEVEKKALLYVIIYFVEARTKMVKSRLRIGG
jgi:hypothetical protein